MAPSCIATIKLSFRRGPLLSVHEVVLQCDRGTKAQRLQVIQLAYQRPVYADFTLNPFLCLELSDFDIRISDFIGTLNAAGRHDLPLPLSVPPTANDPSF